MFGFTPRATKPVQPAEDERKAGNMGGMPTKRVAPPAPKPAVTPPVELGTGALSRAAASLMNRRQQLDEAENYANGGMVRGLGTGTSDSIKAKVPAGSYIMPADSTDEIGEQQLSGLGFKPQGVKANLSNGEYQLPPEQVHAIGVQALDQMKGDTHTPVAEARGFKPQPEMFFADGGVIDPAKKRQPLPSWGGSDEFAYPNDAITKGVQVAAQGFGDQPGITASALGFGPRAKASRQSTVDEVSALADKGQYAQAAGAGFRGTAALIPAHVADTAAATGLALQPVADFGRGLLGIQDAQAAETTAPAAVAPPPAKAAPTVVAPATTGQPAPQLQSGATATSDTNVAGIKRVTGIGGAPNMFTDNPARAIADANGSAAVTNKDAAREAQDGRLNTRGFVPRSAPPQNLQSDNMQQVAGVGNVSVTPGTFDISGDPALTPGDRNFDPRAFRAALAQQQLDQRGQALQQEGQQRQDQLAENAYQHQDTMQLERAKLGDARAAQGFQTRAQQRLERLYAEYEQAPPERRKAIAEEINLHSGKETPNRFTVVPGGQEIDPASGMPVTRAASVVNNQTGEFVQQSAAAPRPPKAGEQRGQFRFKGGNPADQKNWEKI